MCLADRKVYLQEQKLYNNRDLKTHLKTGDRDTLITHAYCQFCNLYLFDQDKLYEHLYKSHETCFICTKRGKQYQYYKDYSDLENHFRKAHHLCEHVDCLEKRFIVFQDAGSLKIHDVSDP